MKIGVDIRTLMDRYYSGVSNYTFNLLTELLSTDQENEYILYYNSAKPVNIPKLPGNYKVVSSRYPNKVFNYLLQKIFNYPKIDKLMGGVDCVWAPHFNFLSLTSGPKKIMTVHDLSFLRYKEFFSQRKNFWHKSLNIKKLIKNMDKIIAVSENTKRDLMELLAVPEQKIKVIYSGLEPEFNRKISDEQKTKIKEKYKLPNQFILSLSTLEPRKNLISLIRGYEILRESHSEFNNFKLVLAGPKGWKAQATFQAIKNSKFSESIILTDYVDHEDKPALYVLAKIFVYPSFYEGFGFPPLEAMSMGVPTITSFNSSLPEITGKAAWLVDPFSPLEIAQGMYQLLADPVLYEKFRDLGYKRSQEFSWSKTAKNYLQTLEELTYGK